MQVRLRPRIRANFLEAGSLRLRKGFFAEFIRLRVCDFAAKQRYY
jgi:hypothetical protein